MSKRKPFYSKIIDEQKVASLFDDHPHDALKPFKRWFFFMVFSNVAAWLITISGYSFASAFVVIEFFIGLLFCLLAICCGVRYCHIMIKYSIPRKKAYPILFVTVQLLMMTVFCAIPYWTTWFEFTETGYSVHVNALPAFLYLALSVVMIFIHYYAVTNCFKKYYREKAGWRNK
ncbi:MAG: hypothetical protein IK034_03270 [Bacilli bacterium]|nr:hypothetical protein [Bacilli bacterium]